MIFHGKSQERGGTKPLLYPLRHVRSNDRMGCVSEAWARQYADRGTGMRQLLSEFISAIDAEVNLLEQEGRDQVYELLSG